MKKKLAVGIDVGGTNTKAALISQEGELWGWRVVPTPVGEERGVVLRLLEKIITSLKEEAKKGGELVGLGVGVPGLVESRRGEVCFAPNLGWRNFPLRAELARYFTGAIYVENDAQLAAEGEKWQGAAKEWEDFLLVTIGTGIGSGLLLGGKSYRGKRGTVNVELGHMLVLPEGPLCACGNKGCLETLVAAPAIVRRAKELVVAGEKTELSLLSEIRAEDVFKAAAQGDAGARKVVQKVAFYLGGALSNVALLLGLEGVVIGGGVSGAGETLLQPLRIEVADRLRPFGLTPPQIVPAALGNQAGVIGAAKFVFEQNLKP